MIFGINLVSVPDPLNPGTGPRKHKAVICQDINCLPRCKPTHQCKQL